MSLLRDIKVEYKVFTETRAETIPAQLQNYLNMIHYNGMRELGRHDVIKTVQQVETGKASEGWRQVCFLLIYEDV